MTPSIMSTTRAGATCCWVELSGRRGSSSSTPLPSVLPGRFTSATSHRHSRQSSLTRPMRWSHESRHRAARWAFITTSNRRSRCLPLNEHSKAPDCFHSQASWLRRSPSVLRSTTSRSQQASMVGSLRRIVYYRLAATGHRERWRQTQTDALLEFEPVRRALGQAEQRQTTPTSNTPTLDSDHASSPHIDIVHYNDEPSPPGDRRTAARGGRGQWGRCPAPLTKEERGALRRVAKCLALLLFPTFEWPVTQARSRRQQSPRTRALRSTTRSTGHHEMS